MITKYKLGTVVLRGTRASCCHLANEFKAFVSARTYLACLVLATVLSEKSDVYSLAKAFRHDQRAKRQLKRMNLHIQHYRKISQARITGCRFPQILDPFQGLKIGDPRSLTRPTLQIRRLRGDIVPN